ncbi:trichohyalin [Drosophila innubila]|uniref:trichohyalin n=1 Tax=Drosophila innubila TaxID=198719 RepID=UPI00148D0618|nr:trichohyalin [Drosophila innubila]
MSELKFESNCNNFKLDATENLFSKLSCEEEQDSKDELFMNGILCENEKSFKLDLEQVQRRQSIVFENAQEKVTALENLLKTVDPGWSKQPPKAVTTPRECPAPQAYRFKDIYQLRKQQLLRQHLEQERNQRQFHSRPMPNFRQVHQQQANRQIVHRITHPVTPNVLKTSRNMLLKRTQKIEQLIQQREQEQKLELQLRPRTKPAPKFNAIPLRPVNGQSTSHLQLIPKPFRLSTELRAEQRKIFNAHSQQMQENRRRELEEQRRRQEHLEYQKRRELATFRARPNPFRPQL